MKRILFILLLTIPFIGFGQSQLENISTNLNKSLPLKLDEYSTWVNTKVKDGSMIYNYTISTKFFKDYNTTLQEWGKYQVESMTSYYCTQPDHRFFKNNNITCVVIYSDLNGRIVKKFEVNSKDCK